MTNKEAIIHYFSKMDIDMLGLLLDDNNTYQEATKETFLKKLNDDVFSEFKENGDTELIAIKGECNADNCNKGCKGFLFLGKATNNYTAFIFEEINKDIKDIYCCSSFVCIENIGELNKEFYFTFGRDEEASFNPSLEYLIQVQQCEKAYSAIVKSEASYLYKDEYLPWLELNKDLYKSLPSLFIGYKKIDSFRSLYSKLENVASYLSYEKQTQVAVSNFYKISFIDKKDDELLAWLIVNKKLDDEINGLLFLYFLELDETKSKFLQLQSDCNLHIACKDYEYQIKFCNLFLEHYWKCFEKYYTYKNDEELKNDTLGNETDKRTSLNYHLERRKNAALIGIEYPMNIKKDE